MRWFYKAAIFLPVFDAYRVWVRVKLFGVEISYGGSTKLWAFCSKLTEKNCVKASTAEIKCDYYNKKDTYLHPFCRCKEVPLNSSFPGMIYSGF